MLIWGLTFHMTAKLLHVTIRTLDPPPNRIKIINNILVSNIKGIFQVWESPFPLNLS